MMIATEETLNSLVDFDSAFRIGEGAMLSDAEGFYSPDYFNGELQSTAWEVIKGFSGQDGDTNGVMHNSETLSCGMARFVLENPGVYIVTACLWDGEGWDDGQRFENPIDVEGWVLLRSKES